MPVSTHRRSAPTPKASDLHRQWLELVDTEGPFLAIPPLKRVWPSGMPDFRSVHPDRFEVLGDARKEFETAWEALDRRPDSEGQLVAYGVSRDKWVETILRDVAGWAESLQWGAAGVQVQSPNRAVTIEAQGAMIGPDGIAALVHIVDPIDSLRYIPNDLWAATPVDRLEALLRQNNVEVGIVTDGRWWGLVSVGEGTMPASGVVDALTWVEEPRIRDAFIAIIGRQHIIGGDPAERLPALFSESVAAAEDITEALGAQVRRAVELLVQSFSESAREARHKRQPYPLPTRTHDTYEAAVTMMMRVVFLLFAEERGLVPTGDLFERGYGISRELDRLVARESAEGEEALDATSHTWHRLLATSQALFGGASFENLRMPAYGGSLFDPTRFRFLTATTAQGGLAVTVSDRVMLHVLRSVQIALVRTEARHISFRDVDVEQIGYIYEGLLGYTCLTVDETYLGILGKTGAEPELPLSKLEELAVANDDPRQLATAIKGWLDVDQPSAKPPSVAALTKAMTADIDASLISALTQTVGDDHTLAARISPWLGLIRRDLRRHPFVVLKGGMLVKETSSRKNAGAHYTPKSLAEEIVSNALQPLCYDPGPHQTSDESAWRPRTSDEILGLKVADIACGSGAFLVAAARYLAKQLVEAWRREDPANVDRNNLHTKALRQVVANCLYGADINEMAVEMSKLSLWLVSLDRNLPFSFVDDKVFVGNSLLGVTELEQLRKLHIEPEAAPTEQRLSIFDVNIDAIIRKAVDLRERLATEINQDDPARTTAAKHRQLGELRRTTAALRTIADGIVAAGLPLGGKPGRALNDAYGNLADVVRQAYPQSSGALPDSSRLDRMIDVGLTPTVRTDYERWQPIHWVIEAPDVMVEGGGFDAVIGNPPFLGSNKTPGAIGTNMHDWYGYVVRKGAKQKADMVAFFVLQAARLLNEKGTLGLIATNTLAQGDTREVALATILNEGYELTGAIRSRPWPGAAGVSFSAIWATQAQVGPAVTRVCDGIPSLRISALLEPVGGVDGPPVRLIENRALAYNGCYLLGTSFVVSELQANAWIAADSRNAAVLFGYLTGDDLNKEPDFRPTSWAIDFNDMSLEVARTYAAPFAHVEQLVKPMRASNNRKAVRERWWQYAEKRPGLRKAIAPYGRVIAIRQSSSTLVPALISAEGVIDQTIVVFATDDMTLFGTLSSSVHQLWVMQNGLTLGAGFRYTPSDVFDTFPRPASTPRITNAALALNNDRSAIMRRRQLGLTKLYSLVNSYHVTDRSDSDVARMREIHVELDEAVMEAYGWADLPSGHGLHTYRGMERWSVSPSTRVEILNRLLEANQRRASTQDPMVDFSTRSTSAPPAIQGRAPFT